MRIERFKVRDVDDFGGRVTEVRTSKTNFETPSRAATSTEYNYKKNLKIEDPFANNVGEYVGRFNGEDISNFASKNGSYSSRLRTAAAHADQMKFVVAKAYPQYPFEFPFNDRTLRLLIDVQVEAGLDMISIPHRPSRDLVAHYSHWADIADQYAGQLGREIVAVPHVPMGIKENAFQATIRSLWDSRERFPVIGLTFASIQKNKINYDFLRANRDNDSWLHMSAVPRISPGRGTSNLALMHLPQIYGIDTVSTAIPWGGGGEPLEDYQRLRYFDEPTLSVPKIASWIRSRGRQRTDCNCPICKERSFSEIVRGFLQRQAANLDMSPLFGVFRLHEVFRSTAAFDDGRRYISENDFARYLQDRIGSAIEGFRGTTTLHF